MAQATLAAALAGMSVLVAAEGAWLQARIRPDSWLAAVLRSPLVAVVRLVYVCGFPYLALMTGLLPPRLFGLKGLEALTPLDFSRPFPVLLGGLAERGGNLLLAWLPDFGPAAAVIPLTAGAFVAGGWLLRLRLGEGGRAYSAWPEALLDGIHWSFYRAVGWLLFGSLYPGSVAGLAAMLAEYIAVGRAGRFSAVRQMQYALRFAIGLTVTVTFVFVPNLWFALALQVGLAWAARHITGAPQEVILPDAGEG
ncbi:MAG: hypothetical protein D6796_07340 [Caldilineae bacterium]|nr:MAG: hypothetical protein D6796_07340 [Caldilineae bacterium]